MTMDKFIADTGMVFASCNTCINRISFGKCKAFDAIPADILRGANDHTKPYPGDHGIQFEAIK